MRQHCLASAAAITLFMTGVSSAWATVDNSQPSTAALCTGSCGVGSSIGAVRQLLSAVLGLVSVSQRRRGVQRA
jgi:hypothetical protein